MNHERLGSSRQVKPRKRIELKENSSQKKKQKNHSQIGHCQIRATLFPGSLSYASLVVILGVELELASSFSQMLTHEEYVNFFLCSSDIPRGLVNN